MAYERVVKRFYEDLEKGLVMGRRCKRCGAVEFPPVLACNTCSCADMEWVEMDGRGTVRELVAPSMMTTQPINADLWPYMFGVVATEEGTEISSIIHGADPSQEDELKRRLPLPAKMRIIQRDGYKTVIFDLVEE